VQSGIEAESNLHDCLWIEIAREQVRQAAERLAEGTRGCTRGSPSECTEDLPMAACRKQIPHDRITKLNHRTPAIAELLHSNSDDMSDVRAQRTAIGDKTDKQCTQNRNTVNTCRVI
jgi:hypothetical protein